MEGWGEWGAGEKVEVEGEIKGERQEWGWGGHWSMYILLLGMMAMVTIIMVVTILRMAIAITHIQHCPVPNPHKKQ